MALKWKINKNEKEACPRCQEMAEMARKHFLETTFPPLGNAEMYKLTFSVPRGFPVASPFSRETQE